MATLFLLFVAVGFMVSIKLDKLRERQEEAGTRKFKALLWAALLSNLIGGLGCMYYFFQQVINP